MGGAGFPTQVKLAPKEPDKIDHILVNGADITTMEIKTAPQVTKEYNADICSQLGITPPDDYVAIETE